MILEELIQNNTGQTLIEVLAALGASVVITSVIILAVLSALNNTQFSKNQNLATGYAQQGMEIIKKIKSSDVSTYSRLSGNYCLAKDCTTLSNSPGSCGTKSGNCPQNVDIFVREVGVVPDSSDCEVSPSPNNTKVTVQVSWADSVCTNIANPFCHQIKLASCLSIPSAIPGP